MTHSAADVRSSTSESSPAVETGESTVTRQEDVVTSDGAVETGEEIADGDAVENVEGGAEEGGERGTIGRLSMAGRGRGDRRKLHH